MDTKPGDTDSRINKFGSTRKAINYACSTFIRSNFIVAQSAGIDPFICVTLGFSQMITT